MRSVGLILNGPPFTVREVVDAAQRAEEVGFDSFWHAEDLYGPDPFTALAGAAVLTRRIRLGTAVVNPYTRAPAIIASTFAALDQLSRGRMLIGLGVGQSWLPLTPAVGRAKPVSDMRDAITVIRGVLRGDDLMVGGRAIEMLGKPVSLRRAFNWQPWLEFRLERSSIPVYVGTRTSKMLHLAGELADGLILEQGIPLSTVQAAIRTFLEAARGFGRDQSQLKSIAIVSISPSTDGGVNPRLRLLMAARLAAMAEQDIIDWHYDRQLVHRIRDLWLSGEEKSAAGLVPETILRDLVVVGTRTQCIDRLHVYRMEGDVVPLLYPTVCDLELALEIGAEYVRS